ncbi:MAG: hypothetical protein RI101_10815 [Nitrospira sp.]|jgi:hypothetical protein|nr:hypothetical protein [Nitrospira sp.]
MRNRWSLLAVLLCTLASPGLAQASTGELGTIIESFVTHHFPDATSHVWIVNGTQWDGDEMVVDVRTIVVERQLPAPIENRYLLLIKEGKLTAVQRVPLEDGSDCQPDEA